MSQRFVRLAFSPAAEPNRFNVSAPDNPNVAPPGHYMMFVLNTNGVPSVGRMLVLRPVTAANTPPVVNAGPDQTVTLPAVANLAGKASDGGQPGPSRRPGARSAAPEISLFPLSEAAAAHRVSEAWHLRGKLVLQVR
jgi:hypothetical protein